MYFHFFHHYIQYSNISVIISTVPIAENSISFSYGNSISPYVLCSIKYFCLFFSYVTVPLWECIIARLSPISSLNNSIISLFLNLSSISFRASKLNLR